MAKMMIPAFALLAIILSDSIAAEELKLKNYWRVDTSERFDLSGMVALSPSLKKTFHLHGNLLLTNDKSSVIYEGLFKKGVIEIRPWVDLKKYKELKNFDLESIDAIDRKVYVANEGDAVVFEISAVKSGINVKVFELGKTLPQKGEAYAITDWYGIESLALTKDQIFLGKEMPPLAFFAFDRVNPFASPPKLMTRSGQGSQTDTKIKNDTWYILNRETRCVVKTKPPFEAEESFCFGATLSDPRFDYRVRDEKGVQHDEWSTAEALEITENRIFIGLDTNGETLKKGSERRATVLSFERPKNF